MSLPLTHLSDEIPKPTLPLNKVDINETVLFSFKHFKCKSIKTKEFTNKFFCKDEFIERILYFIQKLTDYSKMTFPQLKESGKSTRCHIVSGESLKELKKLLGELGMSQELMEQIGEFFELSVSKSKGRFFGYFVGNVFYVLLLDPHHLVYKMNGFYSKNDVISKSYDPWKEIG